MNELLEPYGDNPMTPKQIEDAKARAEAVINGFKTPSMQIARDAEKLAALLLVRERQVAALAEQVAKKKQADSLGGIFGF